MTVYKKSFYVTAVLALCSLLLAVVLNYAAEESFWCNVMLGVFGSSLLAAITSLIGYFSERRKSMERFYTESLKLLNCFNKYQTDFNLDQQIDFFLDLDEYDTTDWDAAFGDMDFFWNSSRTYVFNQIYKPILDVYRTACSHSWHFRMHKNGTGKNENVMKKFVSEIEPSFIERKKFEYGDEPEKASGQSIKNKLVEDMFSELNGKYYELMYGSKKAKKNLEVENNG